MAGYDPKRPSPSEPAPEEPTPVDALLEPGPASGSTPAVPIEEPEREAAKGSNGSHPRSNGSSSRPPADVPVAPAPEEGTANRAVVIAAVIGSVIGTVLIAVLLRRRRPR